MTEVCPSNKEQDMEDSHSYPEGTTSVKAKGKARNLLGLPLQAVLNEMRASLKFSLLRSLLHPALLCHMSDPNSYRTHSHPVDGGN
jgi:hypothetical protein